MPTYSAPIKTYLRRPRVLVLQGDAYAPRILAALHGAPVVARTAFDIEDALLTLRRSYVTVIACNREAADHLLAARSRSTQPAFLITPGGTNHSPFPADRPSRVCAPPIDPRRVVGDVLALAHGWHHANTQPVALDAHLSVIPDCGLLFCDDSLVPLLRMERLLFMLLSRAPGKLVTWAELAYATGASQKLLYVSADRLRRKLEDFIPGHTYIETQPGRGLALDLTSG